MKASVTILALLLLTGSAAAQEETPRPDYSRDTLLRQFVAAAPEERPFYNRGGLEVRAFGTSFRMNFYPMMALSGSVRGTNQEWPDPFALTGTQVATGPRAWRTRRAMTAELRRIDATERARLRVETR
ncbi:MAG TPA: hypothetical protein VF846_17965 [Thermoanaerobaculia bacterium]|jgi:hypothetical protein